MPGLIFRRKSLIFRLFTIHLRQVFRKSIISLLFVSVVIFARAQPFLAPPKIDPYFLSQGSEWVDSLMNKLTLREKIGQLFMVSAFSNRDQSHEEFLSNLVSKYGIGGVIFFQGGPIKQANITNRLQEQSEVPLLVAMDAEWGVGMRLDSTISYPYQMGLGAIQDDKMVYKMGVEIGRQLAMLGVQINFAPSVDVNNNPDNPVIGFRSFGENKENVTNKGYQYMKGLQDAGLLTSAKHFPGHGDTGTDSHHDLPVLPFDKDRLTDVELYPFKQLINKGVSGVMVAHMNIPAIDNTPNLPSTLSKPIITGLLRDELQFKGLVFTDALNMKGVTKYYKSGEIEVRALLAGNDVLLYSEDVPTAIEAVYEAVDQGVISSEVIEEKCRKVLSAKYFTGLSVERKIEIEGLGDKLNDPKSVLLKRELVEGLITVLENKDTLMPIGDLTNLKIASLSIGKAETTPFQRMLSKYAVVEHYNLAAKADGSEISKVEQTLGDYDIVITGLHDTRKRPYNSKIYSNDVYSLLGRLASNPKNIISSFRNAYSLSRIAGVKAVGGLLTTYEDSPIHEELAAQLIFGAIGGKGRLPVGIGSHYREGEGMDTEGGLRLKYTIPEETGINSRLLKKKIDRIALTGLDSAAYPGCQILVAKSGKVIFHETYGYHTYDNLREVSKDDIYDLASITKVTAPLAGLMLLHDQDKFQLEKPFGSYWEFGWNRKNSLIMRDVLAHQSGLQAWIPYHTTTKKKNGQFKPGTLSLEKSENYPIALTDSLYLHKDYKSKIYKMIKKSPVDKDQGYVYSGLPFYLFPQIIEDLSGQSYEEYLKRNFYRSLGANTLTFNPLRYYPIERIIPTEQDDFFRQTQLHGVVHDEGAAMMDGISGNAGLFGTANDLAKMWQMYQNMGSYGGKQYISETTLREFTTCHYCENGNRRGLGFDKPLVSYDSTKSSVAPQTSMQSFGHSGYTGTFVWADPEYELLYIFLSNRVYPTRNNRKLYELSIRPKIHTTIYEEMGITTDIND